MFDIVAVGNRAGDMNRDALIRALRTYGRKHNVSVAVDTKKGKGSHYIVTVGERTTTVQAKLTPDRIRNILKQLNVDLADL